VTTEDDDFIRTIKFGETAIGHLKANVMPAYPRNYELWYTYVSGLNPNLNRAINDLLKAQGRLSNSETDKIYEDHLSPQRFTDQMEELGGRISSHMEEMLKTISEARDETTSYGQNLASASSSITQHGGDMEKIKTVVSKLINDTKQMETLNKQLENNLSTSQEQIETLKTNLEAIRHESLTDPLTALSNRKLFDQSMVYNLDACEKGAKEFSLLITDIDHFKKFNDTFGHQTGDQVIRLVASVLKSSLKGQDIAARYGGEEFAVILPNTILEHAVRVAENIREAVMGKDLVKRSTNERLGRVTVSVGVSCWVPGDTPQTMIERADAALYHAKRTGRNKVCVENQGESDAEVA
jgi:diguanylate cyclase